MNDLCYSFQILNFHKEVHFPVIINCFPLIIICKKFCLYISILAKGITLIHILSISLISYPSNNNNTLCECFISNTAEYLSIHLDLIYCHLQSRKVAPAKPPLHIPTSTQFYAFIENACFNHLLPHSTP